MPPLVAFFAGAFVPLAVLAAVALAFGATASPFKHKTRAFCKALMPRSISASSCLFCWCLCSLDCLSCGCLSLRCNSLTFQTQDTCLLQGIDAAIDFCQ